MSTKNPSLISLSDLKNGLKESTRTIKSISKHHAYSTKLSAELTFDGSDMRFIGAEIVIKQGSDSAVLELPTVDSIKETIDFLQAALLIIGKTQ